MVVVKMGEDKETMRGDTDIKEYGGVMILSVAKIIIMVWVCGRGKKWF